MREIKFRAWCERDSEWRYGHYVSDGTNHEIWTKLSLGKMYASQISQDDIESIGQFTGLQDKNGKDIYEGDILEFMSDWDNHACSISFYGCGFRFDKQLKGALGINDDCDIHTFMIDCGADYEVIGNIYENPELLEAK